MAKTLIALCFDLERVGGNGRLSRIAAQVVTRASMWPHGLTGNSLYPEAGAAISYGSLAARQPETLQTITSGRPEINVADEGK